MPESTFTRTPDVWERKGWGGWLILVGLPFLCLGGFFAILGLGLVGGEGPPWFVAVFMVPFGGIFASIGALFILGRSGTIIDRKTNTLTQWCGLLVPMYRTKRDLGDFGTVRLTRETRGSGEDARIAFPVRLTGSDGHVVIFEGTDYETTRTDAEDLAKFLGFQVRDESSGTAVVRESDELDESLRDRVRKQDTPLEMPDPPPDMRAECMVKGDRFRIDIPPAKGAGVPALLSALFFGTIFVVFFFPSILRSPDPLPTMIIALPFFGFLVVLPIVKVLQGPCFEQIIVSRRVLKVAKKWRFRTKVLEVPVVELEELTLPGEAAGGSSGRAVGKGITARSDTASIEFGAALSGEEMRWIHAQIQRVLSA